MLIKNYVRKSRKIDLCTIILYPITYSMDKGSTKIIMMVKDYGVPSLLSSLCDRIKNWSISLWNPFQCNQSRNFSLISLSLVLVNNRSAHVFTVAYLSHECLYIFIKNWDSIGYTDRNIQFMTHNRGSDCVLIIRMSKDDWWRLVASTIKIYTCSPYLQYTPSKYFIGICQSKTYFTSPKEILNDVEILMHTFLGKNGRKIVK